jgi:ABC-type dipeptide/oligopeptide/nickel transport system permease component
MRMASPIITAPRWAVPEMSYVLQRLGHAVFVIFGAVTVVFLILYWLPGDPAMLVAGDGASPQTVADIRAQLGTAQPLWAQYWLYLWHLAHGNLGISFSTNEPVLSKIMAQLPPSLALTLSTSLFAILLGTSLGIFAAVKQGKAADRLIQTLTLAVTAMPVFWVGMLLILLFSVQLRWLPAIGNGGIRQLVLPTLALGLNTAGQLQRMVRSSVIEVLHEPFLATLRGAGLKERTILWRHVLRNALIPVITFLGVIMGQLLAGVVVIETLFARQGLGRLIVDALGTKDIPVLQGVVLFASVFYVLFNLLIDLSYGWIDRRTRL